MKVLVTGSAGFIGHALCKKLLGLGHSVIGIDNHNNDYDPIIKEMRTKELLQFEHFEFIKLDVVNEAFPSILHGQKVDYLVHLAAKDRYYHSPQESEYSPFLITNLIGTSKMFELAKALSAKKFIFASTFSVYGITKKGLLTEKKLIPKPISPHGASKLAAEQVTHFMSHLYDIPTVVLRIFTVYGPQMSPHMLIPHIINRLENGKELRLYNDPGTTRDFIYIDDVVNYILLSFSKRLRYQIINIASGTETNFVTVAKEVAKIMGKENKLVVEQSEKSYKKLEQRRVQASIEKAKKIFKYTPQTSLHDGLRKSVEWYLEHPEILKLVP